MATRNDFLNYQVVAASGSSNLTPLYNIYYFAATSAIAYTYNLPAITCDGMSIKIVRNDKLSSATLTVSATNNIIYGSSIITSLDVSSSSSITFISMNSVWYASKLTSQGIVSLRTLFSGNYTSNNGSVYQSFSGNSGVAALFSVFTFLGTQGLGEIISGGLFNIYFIGGTPSVTITLRNTAGTVIMASTNNVAITATTVISFTTVNQLNFPTGSSALALYIAISGGGANKIGISGFVIY